MTVLTTTHPMIRALFTRRSRRYGRFALSGPLPAAAAVANVPTGTDDEADPRGDDARRRQVMKPARWWALTGAVALGLSMAAITGPSAAASPHPGPSHRIVLRGTLAPAKDRAHRAGTVASTSQVGFDLTLALRNAAGAQAFVQQVSAPGSALFHHY